MAIPTEALSLGVAGIAALGAWASQRAASKATTVSTRMDAEKEAYERARQFDIETIQRQQEEIKQLRERLAVTEDKLSTLIEHQKASKTPISLLGLEGLLREREEEDPTDQK